MELKKIFNITKERAEQGCSESQHKLAEMLKDGEGCKEDKKGAFYWFSESAEKGNPIGQLGLGYCYNIGIGTKKDYKKAFEWYTKSADGNNAEAKTFLGNFYYEGAGVDRNFDKAFELYKESAEEGNEDAQYNADAKYNLARMYYDCFEFFDDQDGTLSFEDVNPYYNIVKSVGLFLCLAKRGNRDAMYYLGIIMLDINNTDFYNHDEGVYWLNESSKKGYKDASIELLWVLRKNNKTLFTKIERIGQQIIKKWNQKK